MSRRVLLWIAVAGLPLTLCATGCNHSPVNGLEDSFSIEVNKASGTSEPVKIDFLWVVDNSSSMCEEQVSLTRSFTDFTDALSQFFQIDPRIAVTTHDAQCDPDGGNIPSAKGLFNAVPATGFPPPCQQQRIKECLSDADCAGLDCEMLGSCGGTQGEWVCRTQNTASCVQNPNGTINTSCRRLCLTDAECQEIFADPNYICQKPSNNSENFGCLLPPPTADCPATVPPVLDSSNADLFRCNATVGVNQEKCLKYEQGMRSALMALDPTGPNPEQASSFLREDAYLVIVFISDEDDCSAADGRTVGEDDFETCALLPTTDQGGPLVPVGHYVNRYKSLKSDPGRVIIAAIAGDSTASDPAAVQSEREAYDESKGDPKTCYHQSYICLSSNGKADYGRRYRELVDSMGPNGSFTNICSDEGIGPALENLANTIITVLNKICLPKPILQGLQVRRTNADQSVDILTEGNGPGKYSVVLGSEDCAVDGQIMPAIAFGDPPSPGEQITITYEGDPQFE